MFLMHGSGGVAWPLVSPAMALVTGFLWSLLSGRQTEVKNRQGCGYDMHSRLLQLQGALPGLSFHVPPPSSVLQWGWMLSQAHLQEGHCQMGTRLAPS